jgi:hypothetical protein
LITLRCTQVVRKRLRLAALPPHSAPPTTALGDWYVHLLRLGPQQVVMATSERSLVSVLLPARDLRRNLASNLRIAVEQLLVAIRVPPEVVQREMAEMEQVAFGNAVNRRVIGSMNDLAYQLDAYVGQTITPLELALRLSDTPMSAAGSKSAYGIPRDLARELLGDSRIAPPSQH